MVESGKNRSEEVRKPPGGQMAKEWDVFISHAGEDKEELVRPLAVFLRRLGAAVWYDEFSLRPGESLSRSIDRGLARSRFGLIIISPHFLQKPWPEYELRGLISREIGEDRLIIPIWHKVDRAQVLAFSPPLADKLAIRAAGCGIDDLAITVLREIRPDLYQKHPRSTLERLASGEALGDLQRELDAAKRKLSVFHCPTCGAPVGRRENINIDPG